jgi:hypothetical protein
VTAGNITEMSDYATRSLRRSANGVNRTPSTPEEGSPVVGSTITTRKQPALDWRSLINELTHDDIGVLLKMENAGIPAEDLVADARVYAQANIGTRIHFAHLPEPAAAVEMQKAFKEKDGRWVREFGGTCRPVASNDNVGVTITGKQSSDGEIDRYLYITRQDLDTVDYLLVHAPDLRCLIAVLLEAADELDAAGELDTAATADPHG